MTTEEQPKLYAVCRTSAREGCDKYEFAVVEFNLQYALWLMQQMGIAGVFKQQSESFYRVNYFHYQAVYYPDWEMNLNDNSLTEEEFSTADFQELETAIDNCEWAIMPECYKPAGESGRTECETLGVDESSVVYHCYPKHWNEEVETQTLTQDIVAEIANKLMELQTKQAVATAKRVPREHRVVQIDPVETE